MLRSTSMLVFCASWLIAIQSFAQDQRGDALYQQYCSSCHSDPVDRAPSRLALSDYNPNAIFHALNAGIMQTHCNKKMDC